MRPDWAQVSVRFFGDFDFGDFVELFDLVDPFELLDPLSSAAF